MRFHAGSSVPAMFAPAHTQGNSESASVLASQTMSRKMDLYPRLDPPDARIRMPAQVVLTPFQPKLVVIRLPHVPGWPVQNDSFIVLRIAFCIQLPPG